MKKNYITHCSTALQVTIACLLLGVSGLAATSQAARKPAAGETVQSTEAPARLVIHRLPTLGTDVVLNVSVDGKQVEPLIYGHTFNRSLPAGRHVVFIKVADNPAPDTTASVTVDAQSGKTYNFTAQDESGNLALK
ncbi:MAG: hypothetical protein ACREIF_03885 [Chthoniobacterales bacterium]